MKSPKIIDNLDVGSFWRRKIGGPVFILAGKDHFAGTVKIKTITTEFRIKAETLVNLYVEVDDDDARRTRESRPAKENQPEHDRLHEKMSDLLSPPAYAAAGAIAAARGFLTPRLNAYVCDLCKRILVTWQLDPGRIPFFMPCDNPVHSRDRGERSAAKTIFDQRRDEDRARMPDGRIISMRSVAHETGPLTPEHTIGPSTRSMPRRRPEFGETIWKTAAYTGGRSKKAKEKRNNEF
jgi:hypothetical protein